MTVLSGECILIAIADKMDQYVYNLSSLMYSWSSTVLFKFWVHLLLQVSHPLSSTVLQNSCFSDDNWDCRPEEWVNLIWNSIQKNHFPDKANTCLDWHTTWTKMPPRMIKFQVSNLQFPLYEQQISKWSQNVIRCWMVGLWFQRMKHSCSVWTLYPPGETCGIHVVTMSFLFKTCWILAECKWFSGG